MSRKRAVWVEEGKIKVTPSSVCLLWPWFLWFCFEAYHKGSPLTIVTFPSRFGIWRNKSGLAPPLWFSHGVFKTKVEPLLAVLALGTSSALLICNSKYSSVGKTECSGQPHKAPKIFWIWLVPSAGHGRQSRRQRFVFWQLASSWCQLTFWK